MKDRVAGDHGPFVDGWIVRATGDLPADQLVDVFERGLGALWTRALRTLGEVTLRAIADRVLFDATARHPLLASVELDATGLHLTRLRESPDPSRDRLAAGLRFLLVEFLSVLGYLTAEILTPSLHAELSAVLRENEATRRPPAARVTPRASRQDDEEREP